MFAFDQPLLLAGLLLGVSSSLHCLGMCTGISASLHFAAGTSHDRPIASLTQTTLLINGGRISGYIVAGSIVGGLGSQVFGALDHSYGHTVLRWASAVALTWIGLSMIEIVPLPAALHRVGTGISGAINEMARSARLPRRVGLYLGGVAWGFLPCAMVYAALFYAMLSGSWLNGAIAMAGFGLGTLPMLIGSGLGLPLLHQRASTTWLRPAVGFLIVLVGIASAGVTPAGLVAWCQSG